MNYEIGETYEIKRAGEVIDEGTVDEIRDGGTSVKVGGMWFDARTGNRLYVETKNPMYLGERIEHVTSSEKGQSAA
jgi:hypothetical protein